LLEPEELDRLPLPADRSRLFELLCLVRIARFFVPNPKDVRWLNKETTGNVLRIGNLTCYYQQALPRDRVLATPDYRGSLARSVNVFGVGLPRSVDLAFDFDETRSGFDGLVIEAKSGGRQYGDTVAQLRTYRAARGSGGRYVVWGVVEEPDTDPQPSEALKALAGATPQTEDLWVFSGVTAIADVLNALFPGSTLAVTNDPNIATQ
jgi:hypothetical protein